MIEGDFRIESKVRSLVFGNRYERNMTEGIQLGGVVCPIIKLNGYRTYVYGCGKKIASVILYLWRNDIEVEGIIDRNSSLSGTLILDRVPVIHTSEMCSIKEPKNVLVLINTVYFVGLEQAEIVGDLYKAGLTKFYALDNADRREIHFHPTTGGALQYYRDHIDALEKVYSVLKDDISKDTFLEMIRMKVECGAYNRPQCDGKVKYFYGHKLKDSVGYEQIYSHLEKEVWINCGSNIGDTVFLYFACGLNADCVYAFEGDESIYKRLCSNLRYLPDKYRQQVKPVNTFIDDKTDFNEIIGEKRVTLINADIEGHELEMLKSMDFIIKRDRPVIAVCAYHKNEDLVELPQYILSSVDNYSLLFRKYESASMGSSKAFELVLYAIPNERLTV